MTNCWKKCSSCKKEILFSSRYYLCSVSTCRHSRKGFQFCSVPCWDAHLGYANHREAWAEEAKAPSGVEVPGGATPAASLQADNDVLVVVSKVKKQIADRGFNTSQCFITALTKLLGDECSRALENAKGSGRKTLLGRDIK